MLWRLLPMRFTSWYETIPCLILTRQTNRFVTIRINRRFFRCCKPLDMGCIIFPIIFNLHGVQKATSFFMGYVTIVIMVITQFILHGCGESFLSRNLNNVFFDIFVADGPIRCLKPSALHRRWGQVFCYVMHLTDVIVILLNSIESFSTRMVVVSFNSCLLYSILEVRWSILIDINFNPIW